MGNYIGYGQYNHLYKYIWFYVAFKFASEYLIGEFFEEKIGLIESNSMPQNLLIHEAFNYLGTFIISSFLFLYKLRKNQKQMKSNKNIEINTNNSSSIDTREASLKIGYIYNENNYINNNYSIKSFFILIILLFLSIQLNNILLTISLKGLDYVIYEIGFVCYITFKLFGVKIYKHKKYAIYFIIIFCTLFKTISLLLRFTKEDSKVRLYKSYPWIIPIGIICFISISLLNAYAYCKIKWVMDIKYFSHIKILIIYGFLGASICFIISIIPTLIPCTDKNDFNNIDLICNVKKITENNRTIYYYDSYSIFFSNFGNFVYVMLYIVKLILCFGVKLFSILIIKFLSPEYLICANSIHFFSIGLFDFLVYFFGKNNEFKFYKFFASFSDFFHILGSILYLELIELKFFGLDYNLKKNIRNRSRIESNVELDDESENEETKSQE